ncbi:MAG: hypothetical protein IH623_24825 [Verrucomicrobia bacterium]|nr:hypothetical protein [Verrucomicrobiota bacterium]
MARKLRVQYPGAIYHVLNRGDRGEPIFRDDEDRQRLLSARWAALHNQDWIAERLRMGCRHTVANCLKG